MSIQKVIRQTIDLQAGGGELNWPDSLAVQGEAGGHRWEVTVLDGGRAANLAGAEAKCYVVNGDVTTPQVASIAGNVVSVVFAASCYASSGALRAILRVTASRDVSPAVALLRLRVHSGVTDTVADPDGVIPSLSELLDKIGDCQAAEKAASAAAASANTAAANAASAASAANTAASNADDKAAAANTAASTAGAAAAKIDGMTVSASALAAGASPTAAVSETGGHKHIAFGIPRGDKGDTGATPRITIGTVTTGAPGTQADAILTGTAEAPVLSLTIPQGTPGTGSGTVTSVNAVEPDAAGNVALDAADVGALAAGGTAVNASRLGGKAPAYYVQPRNLLDNSDFTNPVNQRGYGGAELPQYAYFIDRWRFDNAVCRAALSKNGMGLEANAIVVQLIEKVNAGTNLTFAVCDGAGSVAVVQATVSYQPDGSWKRLGGSNYANFFISIDSFSGNIQCVIEASQPTVIVWAALYEGTYTADTLPPYVSKGYAAELAECQRYYQKYSTNCYTFYTGTAVENPYVYMQTFPQMRIVPTVTYVGGGINAVDLVTKSSAQFKGPSAASYVSSIQLNADL